MKCRPLLRLVVAASLIFAASAVRAQLIVSDSFNYATGSVNGDNGGSGWEGQAWSSTTSPAGQVTSGGLSFTANGSPLLTSGNKLTTQGSDSGVYRNPPTDFGAYGGNVNQDLWIGFLVQNTTSNLSSGYAGLSLLQSGTEELFIGAPLDANAYGFQNDSVAGFDGAPQLDPNGTPVDTTTHFLVTHLSFTASGTTEISLYFDPTPGETTTDAYGDVLPTSDPIIDTVYTTSFQFNQFRFQSGSGAVTFNFDEFRMGGSFLDVAPEDTTLPEPTAIPLLAVAVCGMSVWTFIGTGRRFLLRHFQSFQ